jgi:hypothetical protein
MFGGRKKIVSQVKKRTIDQITDLIMEIGRNDFEIELPDKKGYILELTPSDDDISITTHNLSSDYYSYDWLNDSTSMSFLLYIVEELKFILEYERIEKEIESKKDHWDNKKRIWTHKPYNKKKLENFVRSSIRKTRMRKYVATKSKISSS